MTDQDLRDLLRETPTPPTRLTLESLVERGRRSVRRRRYGLTGTAAVGVALAIVGTTPLVLPHSPYRHPAIVAATPSASSATPTTPTPQPSGACAFMALTLPAGVTSAEVWAVDPSGHLIAGLGSRNEVVLWRDGIPSVLPAVASPGETGVTIGGVNTAGVVVGSTAPSATSARAWTTRVGSVNVLPAPPGHPTVVAKAVNAAGDVAGFAISGTDNYVAVVWPAAAPGRVTELTAPPSKYGAAVYGIGDDGTLVGDLEDSEHPYVWDRSGQGHVVAESPGLPGGRIFGISGDWAVGWVSSDTGSTLVAARWNLRTGALSTFDVGGPATAVAADGTFLAHEISPPRSVRVGPDGSIRQLANPAPTGQVDARGISADGRTVAGVIATGGNTPDPAAWYC